MTGRELLEALGPMLAPAREIRYRLAGDFDDVSTLELERAVRALHALAYSCETGARYLARIAALRPAGAPPIEP